MENISEAVCFSIPCLFRHICTVTKILFLYSSAKDGTFKDKGWPESAYGSSKIGVTLLSFAQQREFEKDSREDILVNAVSRTSL